MTKTRSRKTQEAAAWKAFSRYIRLRDAIRTTGTTSSVVCFTCGKTIPRAESQAGHIVSRAYHAALYNPQVVFAQCPKCNLWFEGNHILGFLNLIDMVGFQQALSIVRGAIQPLPISSEDLVDIEEGCDIASEILEDFYERNAQ
jgi:hypothetical protein